MEHMINDLKAIDRKLKDERQHLKTLQKTRRALDHEIRLYTEVEMTTGQRINPTPKNDNEELINNWLSHRTDSLVTKIYKLQRHLQESSKRAVLERFA